jgi:hypothetical protein
MNNKISKLPLPVVAVDQEGFGVNVYKSGSGNIG